mgnify:CR=1 FL=1
MKQTAIQELKWFVSDGLDNFDESLKVSEIWEKINELLEIEKQQQGYSEEEVKNIVDETIEKFYKHFYTLTKAEMKEQWFEQFKKK